MILPSRHIRNCESLLGLATITLSLMTENITVEKLWLTFQQINNTPKCPTNHSFDNFILSLDLLFLLEKVELNEGKLAKK